jgi:hypothetical protein
LATTGIAGFDNDLMIRAIVQEGSGPNARVVELSPNGERHVLSSAELKQLAVKNNTLGTNPLTGAVCIDGTKLPQTKGSSGSTASISPLSIESLTGYNIYRSDDSTNFAMVASVDSTILNYSDHTVVNGTKYWYYVKAVYTEGESDPSNIVSATPQGAGGAAFFDNFDSYTAGTQLVVQNPNDWTTWSNLPGSGEDPFVTDAQAYSGANSVVIVQNNDLVKVFDVAPLTSGMWKLSWQMYIPTGGAGYFNTLADFAGGSSEFAMQVYFDAGGTGRLDAGGASAATFNYAYDTWQPVAVVVDLDNDVAEFWLDGTMIYTWQYTLGTFGTPTIPLQLDANDFFGATAADQMYIDDYDVSEIVPAVPFFDDFDSYTAGVQLALQNPTNWTTWSNLPGSGEDPYVSDAHAYSSPNSVVIAQNNDLVKTFGQLTSGMWKISFQVYIPTGKTGYFNTLSGFTPNPYEWGMECYFNPTTGQLYAGSSTSISFPYANDTWQLVEVIVDLDNDMAQFWFDGAMIHEWQWTLGASGAGSALELDANDFFGATANDEMYFDDYDVSEYVPPVPFFDNFDSYTAGVQLALQNPTSWTTWSGLPGSGEDAYVSDAYSYSSPNSVVIAQDNDLVKTFGELTSGKYKISFQVYIPTGKTGYFNTLSGFTPNPYEWGMECYFNPTTGQLYAGSSTSISFPYANDTWQLVELIVDLDNDLAQFRFDGAIIHTWQWTLGASGGGSALELDANDFFGSTSNDEMYFDNYDVRADTTVLGIGDGGAQLPTEFALYQNYPNPFNPTTTIRYDVKQATEVKLVIYNMLGQEVRTLVNNRQDAGYKTVVWDGLNNRGSRVASGIYIYRLKAGDFVQARKMILMK